jgi:hypothetical protein
LVIRQEALTEHSSCQIGKLLWSLFKVALPHFYPHALSFCHSSEVGAVPCIGIIRPFSMDCSEPPSRKCARIVKAVPSCAGARRHLQFQNRAQNLLVLVHVGGYHPSYEKPPKHCEVTPGWIPTRCARSKTDAPPSKNVRSNRRADSGPDPRDTRSDIRRLHSGGRIAEQDREVSGPPGRWFFLNLLGLRIWREFPCTVPIIFSARASRSRCQPHLKRQSQHDVNGYNASLKRVPRT